MTKSRVVLMGHEGKLEAKEKISGTLAADTYYYAVTAVVDGTEDVIDLTKDDSVVLSAVGAAMICWRPVSDASEYRIYRKLTQPSANTDFNGSRLATIPGSSTYFIDDGSLSVGTGNQGAGTNTPTIYGHVAQPQTRFPTGFTECAFRKFTLDIDEGYSQHAHGGDRRKTQTPGSIEVKGTIERYMTDGRWKGAVYGSDLIGTTNTTISYINQVDGEGTGHYDGTDYTSTNNEQSPIPREKPEFSLRMTDEKSGSVPIVDTIDTVKFTTWKKETTAEERIVEVIEFIGEIARGQYDSSVAFG